jgi:IS4 transposase
LADANNIRHWRIFADFAQILISIAKPLHANDDIGIDLDNTVYALDASTIDLCLSLFPWASFRKTKAAVKLHAMIDLHGNIPEFIHITNGKVHDVNAMDLITYQPGAYYVMDRGYLDFARLFYLNQAKAYFVIRAKKNTKYTRQYSQPVDKTTGVQCDQIGYFKGRQALKDYPESLRRVRYYDSTLKKRFVFLTNHMELPASTIADIYKSRWQIELFFKWIKQHLHVKVFYGETMNAVKSQLWIAISTYVLISIIRKRLGLERSLYDILQILTVSQFEKTTLSRLFTPLGYNKLTASKCNQLTLFDL